MAGALGLNILMQGKDLASHFERFNWTAAAVVWADQMGPVMREAIKAEAPVGKENGGRLRDSIRYERKTGIGGIDIRFTTTAPYAGYVIHGTRPHDIRPVAALALHWQDAHGDNFATLVHHPGTKANDFPKRALEKSLPFLASSFKAAVGQELPKP